MEKYNIAIELTQDEQKVLVGQMNDCRKKLLEEDKPTEDIENIIVTGGLKAIIRNFIFF